MNMGKFKIAVLLSLLALYTTAFSQSRIERLEKCVRYLASDSLNGRKAGSEDAFRAAEYLKNGYREIGLQPYCLNFFLPYEDADRTINIADSMVLRKYRDVVSVIPGSDPLLKDEYIVLAAHYDHLGKNKEGEVYNGADDNASGSAALLEVARELAMHPMKRSVMIAAVDAEEIGLYGSRALVQKLQETHVLQNVKLMMSLDMVGWLRQNGSLIVEGYGTMKHGGELLEKVAKETGMSVTLKDFEGSVFTATDTEPFAEEGIPTLAVTTGLKSPYHKTTDDADLIDYEGISKVVDYVANLTMSVANDGDFKKSGKVAQKHGGNVKPVECGFFAGFNTSHLNFKNTKIRTRARMGLDAGLNLQFNFSNSFALRLGGEFNRVNDNCVYVEDSRMVPVYVAQNQISVPLSLVGMYNNNGFRFYYFAGFTYSYCFEESNYDRLGLESYNESLYGFNVGFGLKAGHLFLENSWSPQFDIFDSGSNANPRVNGKRFSCRLGWMF